MCHTSSTRTQTDDPGRTMDPGRLTERDSPRSNRSRVAATSAYDAANAQEIKVFRATRSNIEQIGPIISGFGVRVPGGAQTPRSRRCPGLLHVPCAPLTHHFPDSPRRVHPRALGRHGLLGLPLTVTVRHITSVRIGDAFADSTSRPALSSQPSHRLEARHA